MSEKKPSSIPNRRRLARTCPHCGRVLQEVTATARVRYPVVCGTIHEHDKHMKIDYCYEVKCPYCGIEIPRVECRESKGSFILNPTKEQIIKQKGEVFYRTYILNPEG